MERKTEDLAIKAQREIWKLRTYLADTWSETKKEHDYNMLQLAQMASDLMYQIMYLEENRTPWNN